MGKRGENIRKRADGRWEARIIVGKPAGGKSKYKYVYGASYREVRQKKKTFLVEGGAAPVQQPLPPLPPAHEENSQGGVLFRDIAAEWLDTKQTTVKESTCVSYAMALEKHVLPALGNLPAGAIDRSVLEKFLAGKKSCGRLDGGALSHKSVADLRSIVMQVLRYAVKCGVIGAVPDCPATGSRQPEISVLTKQEQEKLEETAIREDTPFCMGVLLSLYGGLRIGEVCGLRWADFDLENGTVSINRTVSRIVNMGGQPAQKTKVVISAPKTSCSLRTIPLPEPVLQLLLRHRQPDEMYVATGTDKYMEPRVLLARYKRLLRRAGVSDHTYHTLRHTFATRCVECGVDIKSLSEIMGHSDVKITLQRYVHPSIDAKKRQIDKLPCFRVSGQNHGRDYKESA
ncbi:MAG: site-specific integrase [Clostridiales bacterium]|nr:site-specific integrase [Clostridiales bacterium]